MSTSFSKVFDTLSEIYITKCRDKSCEFKCEFKGLKNNKLSYSYKKECRKNQIKAKNRLIQKLPNAYKFCNNDINKFILLLRKGVYPCEYLDSWERFNHNKKAFYSKLYLEDITDEDYIHAQKVTEDLKLKNLGEYHDVYVQSDTLLLADVFENFRNKCIEIYELDPAHFFSASGLAWQACFKEDRSRTRIIKK